MPIVLAIQNASVAGSLGSFSVFWQIRQLQEGQFNPTSSGTVDYGDFQVFSNETSAATTLFLVDFTNVTDWIQHGLPISPATKYTPAVDDRYMLQWSIVWTSLFGTCAKFESLITTNLPADGALTFNIQTVWGGLAGRARSTTCRRPSSSDRDSEDSNWAASERDEAGMPRV